MIVHPRFARLAHYATRDEAATDRTRTAAHVASCPSCRAAVTWVRDARTALRDADGPDAPVGTWERIQARLEAGDVVLLPGAGGAFDRTHRIAPVSDAEVRVSGAGQSIALRPDGAAETCVDQAANGVAEITIPLARGCYSGLAEDAIVAGALYELHVSLGDGTVVTGEAEVPRPTTIRTPEAGTALEVRWSYDPNDPAPPHPLTWTDPGPDRATRLRLEADSCGAAWTTHEPGPGDLEEPLNISLPHAIDLTGRDSASVGGWYLSCDTQPPGEMAGALQLAVLDHAYAQYLDMLTDAESITVTEASIGLSGAAGVFTGVAITRQPVRLIVTDLREPESP